MGTTDRVGLAPEYAMNDVPEALLDLFIQDCRRAADHGLMRASSGNASLRLEGGRLLATASRSWLERLTRDDLSVCRLDDSSLIEGGKPTVEIGFHTGVLRARPDMNVVLHFQTPCATALACRECVPGSFFVIPEIPFYIGPVARVPFLQPGSGELARAVTEALRDHDMVMLSNHGQVTVAKDMEHAIQNARFLELACEIILRGGDEVRPIPDAEVQALLAMRAKAGSRSC